MELLHSKKEGSVLGGTLLISGCCVGAGMLGLPVLTAETGFFPSLAMFLLSWLFMISTGLLLLEVNLWFSDDVSIISMAGHTLGIVGKALGWFLFLFLFYSLMVAYVSGSGELFTDFFEEVAGISLPDWVGSLCMVIFFGFLIYLGTLMVDKFNRVLMLGLIVTYLLLVVLGSSHVQAHYLAHYNWPASLFVLPVMIISFGFHNLIPSLTTYFKKDSKRLILTLILGSAIPLVIYLIWEWLILGMIPVEGEGGFKEALDKGEIATRVLKGAVGFTGVLEIAQYFAFFAILTSILGVALSLVDFLADGLHIAKTSKGKALLAFLAVFPPFVFSLFYPHIFLNALNYAGGFGAVILFGILPALMVWKGRYSRGFMGHQILPGGKPVLILIMAFLVPWSSCN